jgi:uncharacterized membrane protein
MGERWPRIVRLILLISIIWFATWGGMAYARGDMGWYFILEAFAACAAHAIYFLYSRANTSD